MGKSQYTPFLAAGMNGKRGFEGGNPLMAFSLEDSPQLAVGFFTRSGGVVFNLFPHRIDVPSQFVVVPWRGTEIHIIVLVVMAPRRRMDQSWAAETKS